MKEFVAVFKALSDESRIRLLMFLCRDELCVCQIVHLLGLSPATVSKHISVLRQAGLVEGRKSGRWHYYRLASHEVPSAVRSLVKWIRSTLGRDPILLGDRRKMKTVLRQSIEKLCECYAN